MNAPVTDSLHAPHRSRPLLAATFFATLAFAVLLRAPLQHARQYSPAYALSESQREEINETPIALMMGEVRSSMADLMWIKTERYVHLGVAFQPHLDADEMARSGETAAKNNAKAVNPALDDAKEVTLVPAAEHDYRGFVGEIQRRVQPWQDMNAPHKHQPGDELLPWYRLLTFSNPHHWRAYMTGAWWISREKAQSPAAAAEAMKFLDEGIANNPEVFQLPLERGRLRLEARQYEGALADFRHAAQLALNVRPADGKTKEGTLWTDSDEEDFAAAIRYIPTILSRYLNQPQEAKASLARALAFMPNDKPLQNLVDTIGLPAK